MTKQLTTAQEVNLVRTFNNLLEDGMLMDVFALINTLQRVYLLSEECNHLSKAEKLRVSSRLEVLTELLTIPIS